MNSEQLKTKKEISVFILMKNPRKNTTKYYLQNNTIAKFLLFWLKYVIGGGSLSGPSQFSKIAGNAGNHGNDGKRHKSHLILNQILKHLNT